jgi:hypothetical protein
MRLTRSAVFFVLLATLGALGTLAAVDAASRRSAGARRLDANRALVRALDLTDPCLFTDARYTRHPSLADRHSPFQDYPLALEHFPTGSLSMPPSHLAAGEWARGADGHQSKAAASAR